MKSDIGTLKQKHYNQGFTFGMLPVFADFENSSKCGQNFKSEEFYNGFCDGRRTFIELNGDISNGVPSVILTPKILQNYFICGSSGR